MNVNVNVKRKFKVNGKEYNSIEEMPQDIRNAFEKAIASQAGKGQSVSPATMQTKIIFTGTESWYREEDRVKRDIVIISAGSMEKLKTTVMLAKNDYRDVLIGEAIDPLVIGELSKYKT